MYWLGVLVSLVTICFMLMEPVYALPRIALATTTMEAEKGETPSDDDLREQGAGIDLGVRHLVETYGHIFNFSHEYLMDPDHPIRTRSMLQDGRENLVAKFVFQNKYQEEIKGLALLSSCIVEALPFIRLTKALKILHGCSVGRGFDLRANPHFFSLSTLSGEIRLAFIVKLLQRYGWSSTVGLVDKATVESDIASLTTRSLLQTLSDKGIRYDELLYYSSRGAEEANRVLQEAVKTSRVVFLLGSGKASMIVLRKAEELGMTNGDYVFLMNTYNRKTPHGDKLDDTWWDVTDANADLDIPSRGYVSRAVIVISFVWPYDNLQNFRITKELIHIARISYGYKYPGDQVPSSMYASYDMFELYGQVLNDTFRRGGRVLDGLEMGAHIRNKTFLLHDGPVSITAGGIRLVNMTGEVVDPTTGKYVDIMLYEHGRETLTTTGPIINLWPGGRWPPPNEPLCGFRNDKCLGSNTGFIEGLAYAFAMLIICALSGFQWRRLRLDTPMWWLIADGGTVIQARRHGVTSSGYELRFIV